MEVQTEDFISDGEIQSFLRRFDHILVHLDIDVLDPRLFPLHLFCQSVSDWGW